MAKVDQSDPEHRKIVSAVKAGIVNQYTSEILEEFSHLENLQLETQKHCLTSGRKSIISQNNK